MKSNQIHIDFKLNGESFSSIEALLTNSKTLPVSIKEFLTKWFSKNDFLEVSTSGSTGKPKLIKLKKEFMINSAIATGSYLNLPEKTTALLCMSTDFIAGKMMLVRALVLGWELDVVLPVSNPLACLNKTFDFSAMVPMQLQNSLTEIYKVKKLIVGGGVVSKELEKQMQLIPTEVFATFGMTETITHIALKRLNHFGDKNLSEVDNSYYKCLPNVSIKQDNRSCLVIKAFKVSDDEIITNDVVKIISDNEFKWLGRIDNVINSGGIKLHPELIEKKLSQLISQRFFITGVPDKVLGEKLILIIEGIKSELNFKKLVGLSKYEIPKEIYYVNRFIETRSGKIQRDKTLDLILKRN